MWGGVRLARESLAVEGRAPRQLSTYLSDDVLDLPWGGLRGVVRQAEVGLGAPLAPHVGRHVPARPLAPVAPRPVPRARLARPRGPRRHGPVGEPALRGRPPHHVVQHGEVPLEHQLGVVLEDLEAVVDAHAGGHDGGHDVPAVGRPGAADRHRHPHAAHQLALAVRLLVEELHVPREVAEAPEHDEAPVRAPPHDVARACVLGSVEVFSARKGGGGGCVPRRPTHRCRSRTRACTSR